MKKYNLSVKIMIFFIAILNLITAVYAFKIEYDMNFIDRNFSFFAGLVQMIYFLSGGYTIVLYFQAILGKYSKVLELSPIKKIKRNRDNIIGVISLQLFGIVMIIIFRNNKYVNKPYIFIVVSIITIIIYAYFYKIMIGKRYFIKEL
ncbi:MAG: hypothetical protein LBM02_05150 [Lachnospiraceae bacterium]|jgi:hypothetical protein|nr:hypothetical protein [Lachnospiraceae bacterium]